MSGGSLDAHFSLASLYENELLACRKMFWHRMGEIKKKRGFYFNPRGEFFGEKRTKTANDFCDD